MRVIYSILSYLAIPFIFIYLRFRARKNLKYLLHWSERFACALPHFNNDSVVCFHAVSVGEVRALAQLINLFQLKYPNYQILITVMTPTGRDIALKLYPQVKIHYLPYDIPLLIKKFYQTVKPRLLIIVETEIWPNLIYYAKKFQVKVFLINARLSSKSLQNYQRFSFFFLKIINYLDKILCQDSFSLNNFKNLGYKGELLLMGNTKFDLRVKPNDDLIKQFNHIFQQRLVICFASTRNGEEEDFIAQLNLNQPWIYLFVPRHPERFVVVEELLLKKKINYQKRSANQPIRAEVKVVIGDSMGEMLIYLSISHLTVIGGSFKDFGGQSPIESISLAKPVIFGLSMYNFTAVSLKILELNCGLQVRSVEECITKIDVLVNNNVLYNNMAKNCLELIKQNQGASAYALKEIDTILS